MRREVKDLGSYSSEGPRGRERTEVQKNWELIERRALGLSRDRRFGDTQEDREC